MADEAPRRKKHSQSHNSANRNRRSGRHQGPGHRALSFFQRFWLEILALVFLGLGTFLLVEQLEIKVILWRWISRGVEIVGTAASSVGHWIAGNLSGYKESDLVGIALILTALLMIGWRVRSRAIARHPPPALKEECPKCQAELVRVPRRLSHRLLEYALWLRIRRYGCSKCSFRTASWHRPGDEE